jgi:hypothetical protein
MPNKEQFEAYVKVQQSGRWNMFMDAKEAAKEAGLDLDTYFEVLTNYSFLANKFKERST